MRFGDVGSAGLHGLRARLQVELDQGQTLSWLGEQTARQVQVLQDIEDVGPRRVLRWVLLEPASDALMERRTLALRQASGRGLLDARVLKGVCPAALRIGRPANRSLRVHVRFRLERHE